MTRFFGSPLTALALAAALAVAAPARADHPAPAPTWDTAYAPLVATPARWSAALFDAAVRGAPVYAALHDAIERGDWYGNANARALVQRYYPADYRDYVAANRVQVAIVAGGDRGLRNAVVKRLYGHLPDHVELARSPRRADIVIRLDERRFDYHTYPDRVRERSTKYPRRLRRAYNACDRLFRAFYTEVELDATARYDYRLDIRGPRGRSIDRERIAGQVREDIRFARNLRAQTGCGVQPTRIAPSNRVARLLANGDYAEKALHEALTYKAAAEVAEYLAYYDFPTRGQLAYGRGHRHDRHAGWGRGKRGGYDDGKRHY